MTLKDKIEGRSAWIGVIGLGYVGLPLSVEFANAGFCVTGFDVDASKVAQINSGTSYIPDVPTKDVESLVNSGRLQATSDFSQLLGMDAVIICVPTPLKKTKDPDIQYIVAACQSIAEYLHPGMFISLESSTYPGTTDEVIINTLLQKDPSLIIGEDIFVCYSPERVDPGNQTYQTRNIPKIVGGCTPACTEMGQLLYSTAVDSIVTVEGTRTAEMVKLLENTFRMVNIGLVNELAVMCDKMGINIWDVIAAAKTKPFGYMPFYPGPGLGGHCIPIDPFYLSWKSKQYGCEPRFIETAGYVNAGMPEYVVHKVQDALNRNRKSINGSSILIMGMAYKKDIDDMRESPALDIAHLLIEKGAQLSYYDPYVPEVRIGSHILRSEFIMTLKNVMESADCVVIATDHSCINYRIVLEDSQLVVDTRNALRGLTDQKIVRI